MFITYLPSESLFSSTLRRVPELLTLSGRPSGGAGHLPGRGRDRADICAARPSLGQRAMYKSE
eukprot:616269-Alexandrium_andersonii.AAC.1